MSSADPNPAPPDPMRVLGRYELIARIGEGGMAEVHLARMHGPRNFQKVVVVKTIHPDLATQEEFLEMLLDEARLSALIKHPRVVDIYELGQEGDTYFIAMEYLDGQPLGRLMAACRKGYDLDVHAIARIIADAAEGLHAAHDLQTMSGKAVELVHRDVSPGNVMVLHDGTVKIVDFGVAKARGRLTTSGLRQVKGKLGYMSPEQLAAEPIDRRSDIYSLGVVMWEALTHRRLYPADDPTTLVERMRAPVPPPSDARPQVPPALDAVVVRALAYDPAERFQTAAEMREAIERVLRDVGSYREQDTIAAFMAKVFARSRHERHQILRRRASTSAEVPVLRDDEPKTPSGRPSSTPSAAPRAKGTPASSPAAGPVSATSGLSPDRPRKSHWRAAAIATAVLACGAGLGVVLSTRSSAAPGVSPDTVASTTTIADPLPAPTMIAPAAIGATTAPAVALALPPPPAADPALTERAPTGESPAPARPATPARSASALYAEGAELFVKGQHEKAKDRFKQAIQTQSSHAPSHRGLGLVYQAQGKNDKAVKSFEKYLRLAPEAPDATAIKARIARLGQ